MKILINNRDLAYTIDTYGMFTGEHAEESEREYLVEQYPALESKQFELYFDYNHPAIVKALAISSVSTLENELRGDAIVKSIAMPTETRSPQFYNYTTDSYTAEWDVDEIALQLYVNDHGEEFRNFARESSWGDEVLKTYWNGIENSDYNAENAIVAQLDFYLRNTVDVESYEMTMFEAEGEAYYENMKPDEDTQKLIDAIEAKGTK